MIYNTHFSNQSTFWTLNSSWFQLLWPANASASKCHPSTFNSEQSCPCKASRDARIQSLTCYTSLTYWSQTAQSYDCIHIVYRFSIVKKRFSLPRDCMHLIRYIVQEQLLYCFNKYNGFIDQMRGVDTRPPSREDKVTADTFDQSSRTTAVTHVAGWSADTTTFDVVLLGPGWHFCRVFPRNALK